MKRYIVLNLTPFLVWILWFIFVINDFLEPINSSMIQLGLLVVTPIIFAVINVVFAKDGKLFLCFNGVFAVAHIFGYYLSGALYHSFISNDSETELVINTFSFISILYIAIITLVCFLVKMIFKKSNRLKEN